MNDDAASLIFEAAQRALVLFDARDRRDVADGCVRAAAEGLELPATGSLVRSRKEIQRLVRLSSDNNVVERLPNLPRSDGGGRRGRATGPAVNFWHDVRNDGLTTTALIARIRGEDAEDIDAQAREPQARRASALPCARPPRPDTGKSSPMAN